MLDSIELQKKIKFIVESQQLPYDRASRISELDLEKVITICNGEFQDDKKTDYQSALLNLKLSLNL